MTLPVDTSVTPFKRKRAELHAGDLSEAWYRHAAKTLRGGDGGEHGFLLYKLLREGGIIVLDDYHLGVSAVHIRSRLLNLIVHTLAKVLPSAGKLRPGLGKDNEFVVVKQRFSGIRHAVREFLEERQGRWAREIIPMPTRGEYQGDDYALALLTRTQQTEGRAIP